MPGVAKFLARRRGYAPGKTPAAYKRAPGEKRSTGKRRLKSCLKSRGKGRASTRRVGAQGRAMVEEEAARVLQYDATDGAAGTGAWPDLTDEAVGQDGLPDFVTSGPRLCSS